MTQDLIDDSRDLESPQDQRTQGERGGVHRVVARIVNAVTSHLLVVVTGVILIAVWELASRLQPVLVASPWDTVSLLGQWAADGSLWPHVQATVEECLIGAGLAFAVGIPVGILMAMVPWLDRATRPYVDIINTLPRMGLAPLFVLWFGIGLEAKVVLVFSVLVFVVMINTYSGVKDVDPQQVLLARFLGGSRFDVVTRVITPSLVPWLVATLRLVAAYSLGAAVIGEFIAGNVGLGYLLNYNTQVTNARGTFAALLGLGLLATVFTVAVMVFEHRALRWKRASVGDRAVGAGSTSKAI